MLSLGQISKEVKFLPRSHSSHIHVFLHTHAHTHTITHTQNNPQLIPFFKGKMPFSPLALGASPPACVYILHPTHLAPLAALFLEFILRAHCRRSWYLSKARFFARSFKAQVLEVYRSFPFESPQVTRSPVDTAQFSRLWQNFLSSWYIYQNPCQFYSGTVQEAEKFHCEEQLLTSSL